MFLPLRKERNKSIVSADVGALLEHFGKKNIFSEQWVSRESGRDFAIIPIQYVFHILINTYLVLLPDEFLIQLNL